MTPAAIDAEMRQAHAQLATQPRRRRRNERRPTAVAARLLALWTLKLNLAAQEVRREA
jgi:hypothetical protein